jgi:glycine cleavage system aminomethyltransferase T
VTSAAHAPELDAIVALGLVRSSHRQAGTAIRVGSADPENGLTGVIADFPIA